MNSNEEERAAILKADKAHQAFVRDNDRYSTTVNAGFLSKADHPEKALDDAIYSGLCYLMGTALFYLRLVNVTTTVVSHSYGDMVLVTVIAEALPHKTRRDARMSMRPQLEQDILEAARTNDKSLDDLLHEAFDTMTDEEFDRIYDKAHQIMSEALREARGWKDNEEGAEYGC